MADRWLNAVIEVTIPLDVPIDASDEAKQEALVAVMDQVEMPDTAVAAAHWELVEDGEPVQSTCHDGA
jgi:hypothetical protein